MSNQTLLGLVLILPWLTLFFMRKDEIKRFMPVALFTIITANIITEVGETFNLWVVKETIFPLSHTLTYELSLVPVLTMWLFKFTYGRFWRFIFADAIINIGFIYILMSFISARGIYEEFPSQPLGLTNFLTVAIHGPLLPTIHGALLYVYQMWQEDALVPAMKKLFSPQLQTAATKPIYKDEDDKRE